MTDGTASRTFTPGGWYAIVGDTTAVFLPADQRDRVISLWAVVEGGADFDDTLDALLRDGLRALGSVAVVDVDSGRVLARGDAAVLVTASGETVEVRGEPGAAWSERTFSEPTMIEFRAADDDAVAGAHSVPAGLVRVARMTLLGDSDSGSGSDSGGGQVGPAEPVPAPEPFAEPHPGPMFAVAEDDAETSAFEPVDPGTEDLSGMEGTAPGVEPAAPFVEPVAEVGYGQPVGQGDQQGQGDQHGQVDHDGHTRYGAADDEPDRPQVGLPGQPMATSVPRPVARLVFSSGQMVDVDTTILVGRAPEARRFSPHEQPQLVTVPSPNQEISSTHLEVRPGAGADHGSAVVTDLGSTNGTVLVQPGLPPEDLQPGIAVQLIPGAILDLGDGVTIQITNPS